MRASTFNTKEPETIDWIKTFNKEDKLIDIGSNIGIYSLYAAKKGIEVVAIEPDALNHALLSLNILLNNLGKKITPYSIAMHEEEKFSKFFLQSAEWGGALNSFDNKLDQFGNKYLPIHSQGVFGLPLDLFIEKIGFMPNHLKIDVDGNEFLILKGSKRCLENKLLKSILIELDQSRKDYQESVDIIEEKGLKLSFISKKRIGKFSSTRNHIFKRD